MDVLIFDMDGVLMDVSRSYRKAIQRTVQIYLEKCLGFPRRRVEWITNEEISLFKSAGGFNNDWDLTSGVLLYLLSISGISSLRKLKRFPSIEETLSYLRARSSLSRSQLAFRTKRRHLRSFLEKVKKSGGGLRGIRGILGTSWQGWVYGAGELEGDNLVKRIFQELYLGKQFAPYYHLHPVFYRGKGLYQQERLMIPEKVLFSLRRKVRMGIASGRPRFEAGLALKRFHLRPYFDSVVTLDDCTDEENRIFRSIGKKRKCSKPSAYSILKVIEEIGVSNPRCGYVGDVVDDMKAAHAAKRNLSIIAVGFTRGHADRESMQDSLIKAGADLVIENPKELLSLVS
ncbi:MAG TPA: HAD hydrolase-like protein [Thermodesulfobacteriota bacterium]|nr:HAD hydrolase-like protein [Thermodesulfobacteriota bacterium]